jgi:ABC-type polysaccharide/polyol phosphate export permease
MREVRVRYKHAVLGIGWALIMPLSLMLVFTAVFSRVASVQTSGVPYALFVYVGLVPWQLHANIINGGARSLSDNSNLVTKVYFPREVLPLATVISALNLLYRDVQFILQVGVMLWMFASAVVYPIPATGELAWLVWLNPMTPILNAWRGAVIGGTPVLTPAFGVAAALSVVLLLACWRWFRRVERVFGELA